MFKKSKGKKEEPKDAEPKLKDAETEHGKVATCSATYPANVDNGTPNDRRKTEREEALEEQLERERKLCKRQMDDVTMEMLMYKAENEKLRHNLKHGHGTSTDAQKTKKELDHARSTNRFLLENLEKRKNQMSKLETHVFELDVKLQGASKGLAETEEVNRKMRVEIMELLRDRVLLDTLLEENRKLRHFLSVNNLDTQTGKRLMNHVIKRNKEIKTDESGSITERSVESTRSTIDKRPPAYLGCYRHIQKSKRNVHK